MTLCTEWLPEEIVDRGICKPTDDRIARDAELDGMSFGRGWKQHLIISYSGRRNSTAQQEAMLNDFFRPIRAALHDLSNPFAIAMLKDHKRLKQFADEYARGRAAFNNYKAGRLNWSNREATYRSMMRDGILCSNVDAETALDLLHGYYDIRNERNQVNHANSGSTTDIATLEKMINSYLQRLERY